MRVDELETPVPVVDIDRLEANISPLQTYLNKHGIANRPHIKAHKIPQIAQIQIDAGAVGSNEQNLIIDFEETHTIIAARQSDNISSYAEDGRGNDGQDKPSIIFIWFPQKDGRTQISACD